MSRQSDGGQAFPVAALVLEDSRAWIPGMSLLDYFAGQALVGMVADAKEHIPAERVHHVCALGAYMMADAMLAVRAKRLKEDSLTQ